MSPTLSGVLNFCLQVDKLTLILSLLISLGPYQPRAMNNPGQSVLCEKQATLCPTPSDIYPGFFIAIHLVFMQELVILHQLPFKTCFHFLKSFFFFFFLTPLAPPFIFCALPPPRRAKALRIANSPFPHLTSICRRGEKQPWKFNSEFCQFHRPNWWTNS